MTERPRSSTLVRMRRASLVAAVLVAVMLAACGGSGASSTPTPRPAVEPTISTTPVAIGTTADAGLAAGLLPAADLGPGWVAQPTEGATAG
jgi:hypothetical protein